MSWSAASAPYHSVSEWTANGTATAGSDYAAKSGTLTFAAGADPDSLDPQNTQSNPGEQVNRMMYENLVRSVQPEAPVAPARVDDETQAVEEPVGVGLDRVEHPLLPRVVRRERAKPTQLLGALGARRGCG